MLGLKFAIRSAGITDRDSLRIWTCRGRFASGFPLTLCALVVSIRREQFQILQPIIQTVAVPMMDNFGRQKIPTDVPLHHEPMLANVAMPVCLWMLWHLHEPILPLMETPATTPACIPFCRLR